MKIGILTYHHANNYGAFLQCFALQSLLKSFGHEVFVIDYRPQFIEWFYSPKMRLLHVIKLFCFGKFGEIDQYIRQFFIDKSKIKFFEESRSKHLLCTPVVGKNEIPKDFDVYVIGSDQVWSCHCTGGYDPVFWGQFERSPKSKLIGFSISSVGDYKVRLTKEHVIKCFNDFEKVSFRESDVRNDFLLWTGVNCEVTLDPTLLIKKNVWNSLLEDQWQKKNYVVVYQVRFFKGKEKLIKLIAQKYAKEHKCELVDLSDSKYSVEDFISAIKYAKCIFTSSFHATVFSVIFQKKFWSFRLKDGHDNRYVDLLNKLRLQNHICDVDEFSGNSSTNDDWNSVENLLEQLRSGSLEYLRNIGK